MYQTAPIRWPGRHLPLQWRGTTNPSTLLDLFQRTFEWGHFNAHKTMSRRSWREQWVLQFGSSGLCGPIDGVWSCARRRVIARSPVKQFVSRGLLGRGPYYVGWTRALAPPFWVSPWSWPCPTWRCRAAPWSSLSPGLWTTFSQEQSYSTHRSL